MATALLLKSSLIFSLHGAWLFESIIYRGEPQPRPNPNLFLCSEWSADGTSHLFWFRKGEKGICERWGKYAYDGKTLHEEVERVNPDNDIECGKDPDMMVGKITDTPAELKDEDTFHLHLNVGEDSLTYIWKRVEACPQPQ